MTDRPRRLVDAIGRSEALEEPSDRLATWVRPTFGPRWIKNALSGVWLGHRLHPMLTDAVIGTWASAGLLDLLGDDGDASAARRLVGAGVAASLPTALAGLSDYSDLYDHSRRVAFVHAMAADAATVLQVASLVARRTGHARRGRLLSVAALATVGAAGYLGGHLSQVLGVGVDGSVFRLGDGDGDGDGAVVRGPAASPQLRYDVRERRGRLEVFGPR